MATMSRTQQNRFEAKSRPLVTSYYIMPIVAGFVVLAIAAGMLTETLLLASHIDASVGVIKPEVTDIRVHTDAIANLNQVDVSAKGIKSAADPLSGQAATILSTVGTIDGTVAQIDNATGSINAHATAIDATVDSIAPHVLLIAQPVESIARGLATTNAMVAQVLSLVQGIKNDTGALVSPLLPNVESHAKSIDCRLLGPDCNNG